MTNILMIIAPQNFRDEELLEPKKIFEERGFKVTVASKNTKKAKGMLGAVVDVDSDISQLRAEDFDAVVFVGGIGASQYFNDRLMHAIARRTAELGKPVAAICIAPAILAEAGLLKGKRCTSYASEKERIIKKGGKWEDKAVVINGNIITANGPKAAHVFGEEIVKAME